MIAVNMTLLVVFFRFYFFSMKTVEVILLKRTAFKREKHYCSSPIKRSENTPISSSKDTHLTEMIGVMKVEQFGFPVYS